MTGIPARYAAFFTGTGFFGAYGMELLTRPISPCEPAPQPMPGYHVLYTAPHLECEPEQPFSLPEHELLTAELSARLWRLRCGPISLVTDRDGAAYIKTTPLSRAYNQILPILDRRNYGISPERYWAAGKLQALLKLDVPCALLDLDLIIWRPPELSAPLTAAHREPLRESIYPPLSYFRTLPNYTLPSAWNPDALPLNTAFVCFRDSGFQKYYAEQSIRFMRAERETPDNGTVCMVFAEQRILAMCAEEWDLHPQTLLDYDHLGEPQNLATHVWGGKHYLRDYPELQEVYCALCRDRLGELTRK